MVVDYGSDTLTDLQRARDIAVALENQLEELRDAAADVIDADETPRFEDAMNRLAELLQTGWPLDYRPYPSLDEILAEAAK